MPKRTSKEDKENFLKVFSDTYYSIRRSCREVNVGKSTFYRWLQNREFKEEINKIKNKKKEKSARIKRIIANVRALRRSLLVGGY